MGVAVIKVRVLYVYVEHGFVVVLVHLFLKTGSFSICNEPAYCLLTVLGNQRRTNSLEIFGSPKVMVA